MLTDKVIDAVMKCAFDQASEAFAANPSTRQHDELLQVMQALHFLTLPAQRAFAREHLATVGVGRWPAQLQAWSLGHARTELELQA